MAQSYPCQRCGTQMTYVQQYNQWFCPRCQTYLPAAPVQNTTVSIERDITDAFNSLTGPTTTCPYCMRAATLNSQYNRWFCPHCQRWL